MPTAELRLDCSRGGSEEKSMEASLRLLPAAWAALLSLPACPRADLREQTTDWLQGRMREIRPSVWREGWHHGLPFIPYRPNGGPTGALVSRLGRRRAFGDYLPGLRVMAYGRRATARLCDRFVVSIGFLTFILY